MEVEVKSRVRDLKSLQKKLESMGAVFSDAVVQSDAYFKPARAEEGPGDWIIRIRDSGGRKTLTMKVFTDVRGAWIEHETGIDDERQARKMLEVMGFPNAFTFNKKRVRGRLGDFELCLDDVKELGKFIEAALDSEEKDDARERIRKFIRGLGISDKDIDNRGYGEIYEEEKHGKKFNGMR